MIIYTNYNLEWIIIIDPYLQICNNYDYYYTNVIIFQAIFWVVEMVVCYGSFHGDFPHQNRSWWFR